jgi:hypothetical protein
MLRRPIRYLFSGCARYRCVVMSMGYIPRMSHGPLQTTDLLDAYGCACQYCRPHPRRYSTSSYSSTPSGRSGLYNPRGNLPPPVGTAPACFLPPRSDRLCYDYPGYHPRVTEGVTTNMATPGAPFHATPGRPSARVSTTRPSARSDETRGNDPLAFSRPAPGTTRDCHTRRASTSTDATSWQPPTHLGTSHRSACPSTGEAVAAAPMTPPRRMNTQRIKYLVSRISKLTKVEVPLPGRSSFEAFIFSTKTEENWCQTCTTRPRWARGTVCHYDKEGKTDKSFGSIAQCRTVS